MKHLLNILFVAGIVCAILMTGAYLGHQRNRIIASEIWCAVFDDYDNTCRGDL